MTTKARKYKVTFIGPRYDIGQEIWVQGKRRTIVYCYCGMEAQRDEFGGELYQAQWHYRLDDDAQYHSDTVSEERIVRWEEKYNANATK